MKDLHPENSNFDEFDHNHLDDLSNVLMQADMLKSASRYTKCPGCIAVAAIRLISSLYVGAKVQVIPNLVGDEDTKEWTEEKIVQVLREEIKSCEEMYTEVFKEEVMQ